ncbi:hypothetical protein [Albibacillus kandeliae]|uniref:hypothetical protein n=1 Tax=Albibacillus kandeliae TaxID=2174228 RepID=UPI0013009008|nr:hypothetical protein [Albibacillus kandeliae]
MQDQNHPEDPAMLRSAILIVALAICATTATAQTLTKSQRLELKQNCGADIKRLCTGVKAGEGRLAQCIRDKREAVSPACAKTVDELLPQAKG